MFMGTGATWILFLASSRCWMSVGQSCITVVSCWSWQSRYFSPASMYSLHSWAWRLTLPTPHAWPLAPYCGAPLLDSAECRRSKRSTAAGRCMAARGERKGGFWLVRATLEECFQMIGVGEVCRRPVTAAWMEVGGKNGINFPRQIDIDRHNAKEKTSADNSETER